MEESHLDKCLALCLSMYRKLVNITESQSRMENKMDAMRNSGLERMDNAQICREQIQHILLEKEPISRGEKEEGKTLEPKRKPEEFFLNKRGEREVEMSGLVRGGGGTELNRGGIAKGQKMVLALLFFETRVVDVSQGISQGRRKELPLQGIG